MAETVIETNTKTFIKFWLVPVGIGLVFMFVSAARQGLILIGISIFLALALRPLVSRVNRFFEKHFGADRKFHTISAVLAYLVVVLVIGGIIAIVGPVVVSETLRFVQNFPETFENAIGGWDGVNNFGRSIGIENLQGEITNTLENIANQLTNVIGPNLVSSVSGIADGITKVILTLVLTLLFLLDGPKLIKGFWHNLSISEDNPEQVDVAKRIVSECTDVVSTYVSRQTMIALLDGLASCLIVFCLSLFTDISAGLAVPMGLITMVFYMIPMFGQFIGGTLVTLILLFTNPIAALIFAVIYIIYSQVENNILSPKIQGNALKLPAVAILCATVIGMYMFGLLGALIAIPIAGCIRVLIDEYPNLKVASRASADA